MSDAVPAQAAIEALYARGVTDGLPVVPPSPERVDAFVKAAGRDGADVVGLVPPNYGAATVEKVARPTIASVNDKLVTPARITTVALFALWGCAAALPAERLPIRRFTQADGLASDFVAVVRQDSRGFLWFGSDDGVTRFDGVEFRNYGADHGVPQGTVSDILETRDGEILFATGGGICRIAAPEVAADRTPREAATAPSQRRTHRKPGAVLRHASRRWAECPKDVLAESFATTVSSHVVCVISVLFLSRRNMP